VIHYGLNQRSLHLTSTAVQGNPNVSVMYETHSFVLNNLLPEIIYHFRVIARNGFGSGRSGIGTFTTLSKREGKSYSSAQLYGIFTSSLPPKTDHHSPKSLLDRYVAACPNECTHCMMSQLQTGSKFQKDQLLLNGIRVLACNIKLCILCNINKTVYNSIKYFLISCYLH